MRKQKMMLIIVLLLAIGFAAISTTLVITGIAGITSKQSDFDVIFTNAKLDGVIRRNFIDKDDKRILNFITNKLTSLDAPTSTVEYVVTNKSRLYDAEVRITCYLVNESDETITSEYVTMDYEPKSMTVVAGTSETGRIIATLKKTSTIEKDIKVKCELKATSTERTSLGVEYKITVPTGVELLSDANNSGALDEGDEIAIGEEHFYVISNEKETINALAQYNLNVGENKNETVLEGIQNETARGDLGFGPKYGIVIFSVSSTNYTGSVVEGYVNAYVDILNNNNEELNVTGRLITKKELESLGCDAINSTCLQAPDWVYSTSYWTQSIFADDDPRLWFVHSNGNFGNIEYYYGYRYGVRPVIIIPKN